MEVKKGLIARFSNALPAFFDEREYDKVRVIGRLIEGAGNRKLKSVSNGRMISEMISGVDEFDRRYKRCGPFMTGNVVTDVQFSLHVRAQSDVSCNGFRFDEGHLRSSDVKRLGEYGSWFQDWYKNNQSRSEDVGTIAYVIRDVLKSGRVIVRGFMITNESGNLLGIRTLGNRYSEREENSKVMSLAARIVTSQNFLADEALVECCSWTGQAKLLNGSMEADLKIAFPGLKLLS